MHIALDNHDLISMKLYQLTVERAPEEEEEEEVSIPSVDNMEHFQGSHRLFLRVLDGLRNIYRHLDSILWQQLLQYYHHS